MDSISSRWKKPKKRPTKRGKAIAAALQQKLSTKAENSSNLPYCEKNFLNSSGQVFPSEQKTQESVCVDNFCSSNSSFSYILMSLSAFQPLLRNLPCNDCGKFELNVQCGISYGQSVNLELFCQSCKKSFGSTFSSRRQTSSRRYDVNNKIVQAFLNIGKGHAAMESFSMHMETPTMDTKTFSKCLNALSENTESFKAEVLKKSNEIVRKAHIVPNHKDGGVIDITVSYDGTWHKRGHTSLHGIGIVIDSLTNLVVDYEVLSKYCSECTVTARDMGESTDEYNIWFEGHKSRCQKNFSGSSGAMEEGAAVILWERSIKRNNMRYTSIISDGDSKTFLSLSNKKVYGPDVEIRKEECLNHVAKRLGTGLRHKVKEWRVKKVTLGGRKPGSLKEETITKLQNYYRNAIKNNVPDLKATKSAIFASLYHCMSTDENPRHNKCPSGALSWCFYQRAVASGEVPKCHKFMKTKLSEAVVEKIMPVYQRLASDELLKRCIAGKTQNANESLHSCIWNKCPKEIFISRKRLDYAVAMAVSEYNFGYVETLKLKQCSNDVAKECAKHRDMRRSSQKKRKSSVNYKATRVAKKYNKKLKKDTSYKPGGF